MAELADAVDKLEGWGRGVALTLQGAGGTFCSGADLSLARDHLATGAEGRMMSVLMTNTLDRLRRYGCPSHCLTFHASEMSSVLQYVSFGS